MTRTPGAVTALVAALTATLTATLAAPLIAAPAAHATSSHHQRAFPAEFPLPDGFLPEGITIGDRPTAYFGSRADGDLYRVDLRTGRGEVFSQGPGTASVGLKIDRRARLFVAGGAAGDGRVVDARSGAVLASYRFAQDADTFVNDVVVTRDAAYFTDSRKALLYRLPLGRAGELPSEFDVVPLTGDFSLTPGVNNANGITTTPDGRALLVVQSNTGKLFRVNPDTGLAREVDLGGEVLTNGDGLLLDGRSLYVVQNRLNTVALFSLDRAGTAASLVTRLTDPRFDVPTTIARFGSRLYLPNARFTTEPTPSTPYNAVAIVKP
ncbi:SMP-30/gluconolactonase/LRE family protein [Actinosynnema mirum]|uniref:Superoxide dismutase n=1 Tax=Actinosynnema mirum (strain ATCC 29888 / DSM 43827 / JCM 3225 / NBRC 14064 / NCIMB 13271 / NRRL B-12336 / IMRU 3971 / 101) TaxID=446462 RepID=C6WGU2_ACTMD|nr:superoxide dismutase [Actinosynnema mirum]ACU36010.1 superoxide dismutase [Actinosynnema mirum DSM 43827]